MKRTHILNPALLAAAGLTLSLSSALAQNPNYAPGDVVLFFQQFGGSQTLMLNVGYSPTLRDATANIINLANIGTELTSAFGASWYDLSTLYWGAVGVRSSSTNTSAQTDGDPNRTIYVSQLRGAVGTEGSAQSTGWSGFGNTDMTTGSGGIIAMANRMETIATTDRLLESTALSNVDDQNPFLGSNPGTAFSIFPGGVEGSFGAGAFGNFGGVSAEAAIDLYRILASTTASGQVGGPLRDGTYEGSFVINQAGAVSYVVAPVPEPTATGLVALGSALTGLIVRRRQRRRNA